MRWGLIFCLLLAGCSYEYEKLRRQDGGAGAAGGGPGGASGGAAAGHGGNAAGMAGSIATGGTGAGGAAATGGGAGGATGGTGGVAGSVAGQGGSAVGVGGIGGRGGNAGTSGVAGTTGTGGTAGTTPTAGTTGTGGRGGTAAAGTTGTAGTTGIAGHGGTTGNAGRGGATGTAGVMGTAGTGGSVGTGGQGGDGGPCAGLCTNPTSVPPNTNSGDLGTSATCQSVLGSSGSVVCGNFQAPRTLAVNGTTSGCTTSGTATLPAPRNGGWCFQATAGNYSYAYFSTLNVATGGTAGTTGTGGAGGTNMCPLGGVLDCTSAGALTLAPDGLVTDFGSADWNSTTGKWCDADGLDGSVFSFAGAGSTSAAAVDATAGNLKLTLAVTAGQYAAGGVQFDSCVRATAFNSVQFTAAITAGSPSGCTWQVQLATQDQRATTSTNPSGGTCDSTASTCYRFPTAAIAVPSTAGTTYTTRLTAFSNPAGSAIPTPTQIVGMQWQANSSAGTGTCDVELRIDNIRFVTM